MNKKITASFYNPKEINLPPYFRQTYNGKGHFKDIIFTGNKYYKDKKLKNIIISEESKFWKFISNKKYLNPDQIKLDLRLLEKFYLKK